MTRSKIARLGVPREESQTYAEFPQEGKSYSLIEKLTIPRSVSPELRLETRVQRQGAFVPHEIRRALHHAIVSTEVFFGLHSYLHHLSPHNRPPPPPKKKQKKHEKQAKREFRKSTQKTIKKYLVSMFGFQSARDSLHEKTPTPRLQY